MESEEEADNLTEEYFYNSLYLGELSVSETGKLTLYYGDKEEIFAGHAIEVSAKINGDIKDAVLVW